MKARDVSTIETAERLYEEGDYLGSLELVLEVLEKEPDNLKALELKASLCSIKDRLPEAIRAYKELLRFYGSDNDAWAQLFLLSSISSAYRRLKNLDQAISYCERSIELCERFLKIDNPQKDGFIEALVGVLWILGEYQYESRKYSCAIGTYKKLLGLLSEFGCLETIADALYELASTYYKLNDATEVLSKYSEALKLYDALDDIVYTFHCKSRVHYSIGTIHFAAHDYKKALSHLEECVLLIEKIYGEIDDADIEEYFLYKRAKRLQNSLKENKFLWKS